MRKTNSSVTGIIMIVVLSVCLMPNAARAGDSNDERPIRLYSAREFTPIGVITWTSFGPGAAAVNGRMVQGSGTLWGGELVEALRSTRVSFGEMGSATLDAGTAARFGIGRAAEGGASSPVLVASVERGSVAIKLKDAEAYVQSAGTTLTASRGANFGVSIVDGQARLVSVAGVVRVQDPVPPQDVNIRIVDELGRPVASGSQLSVRARSTRQIQVQVTDKNDKPLPDLPVLFSLGDPCLGSLGLGVAAGGTFRQKTDNRGIAAVPLVTGAARCAASILAKVEGTNASVNIQTNVVQQRGFWNTQNTLLVVGAAAAAGVTTGVVLANRDNEPIRPVPPPQVRP